MSRNWNSSCWTNKLVLLAILSAPARADDLQYTYYRLFFPFCHSDPITEPYDLNDQSIITGYYRPNDCDQTHAFLWHNGVMTDLDGTYDGDTFQSGQGVSRTGVIVGEGNPDDVLALIDGIAIPQPVPPGCENQYGPEGINDLGTMAVGFCDRNGQGLFSAAVYWIQEVVSLDLPLLPGSPSDADAEGQGVNDDGIVVGIDQAIGLPDRAFWWQDGVMTEILNGIGGVGANAQAINNHGLVVGFAADGSGVSGAFSYDINTGIMTDLGGTGAAYSINDRSSAVGNDDTFGKHAVLYENGEIINLHQLILGNYFTSTQCNSINNYGWIVGYGDDAQGNTRGWLLVPLYSKGDYDGDEDVDLHDAGHFQRRFAADSYQGPEGGLHVGCSVFDFDDDVDLDLTDYAAFQSAFTGPIKSGW